MLTLFDPRDSFLRWFKRFVNGRTVWDVGCGNGVFLRRMRHTGIRAIGVEPNPEFTGLDRQLDLLSGYFAQYAQDCRALHRAANAVVCFFRPSHDGFLAETVPLLQPDAAVLYASRPDNLVRDVPETLCLPVKLRAPGLRDESLYLLSRRPVLPTARRSPLSEEPACPASKPECPSAKTATRRPKR